MGAVAVATRQNCSSPLDLRVIVLLRHLFHCAPKTVLSLRLVVVAGGVLRWVGRESSLCVRREHRLECGEEKVILLN